MVSNGTSIELPSRKEGDVETTPPDAQSSTPQSPAIPGRKLKLSSAGFSFFVAGTNDGSMGALLPYMLQDYHIGTSFIALMYVYPLHILVSERFRISTEINQIFCNLLRMASSSRNQQPCSKDAKSWCAAHTRSLVTTPVPGPAALETTIRALRDYLFPFRIGPSIPRRPCQYLCELRQRRTQLAWFYTRHVWLGLSVRAIRGNRHIR